MQLLQTNHHQKPPRSARKYVFQTENFTVVTTYFEDQKEEVLVLVKETEWVDGKVEGVY